MNFPLSTYQKLYDSLILGNFSEISYLEVKPPSFPFPARSGFRVNFYLKTAKEIKSMVSCDKLMRNLLERIIELNALVGRKALVDINIYFEGELLCHDMIRI
jgi:hypothetical protein